MIRHCVMLRLRAGVGLTALVPVMDGLADIVDRLDGCSGFHAGPNRDYEQKSPGFSYGFTLDARDVAALAAYAEHPEHKILGSRLVDLCHDGADGIVVYDLEVSP